jgi:phosphonoacetaldehyde hydrolase
VKIGDTPSDIEEGLNAGMWTIGITATGNEAGLSLADWENLSAEQQCSLEREASRRLVEAGAHFTARSVADCGPALEQIERRIAAGGKP